MMSVGGWLAANADLPRLDLELLLGERLQLSRSQIIAFPERSIPDQSLELLGEDAGRLRRGEPLAYLLGAREFHSREFRISNAVLIPRPETELLVECAASRLQPDMRVLDLGTGSGIVAITLALSAPCAVTATDICPAALDVARDNARAHAASVRFVESRWFDAISGQFDMIVSNPPYIAADDPHLPALRFEPSKALVGGVDGLDDLRRIIEGAGAHLRPHGWLLLEHGYDQAQSVRSLLRAAGFSAISTERDLAGIERVSLGRWDSQPGD